MTTRRSVDLSVYFILGPTHCGGHDPAWLAGEAADGGATLVQLRDKASTTRAMIETARAIKTALAPYGVPLIVNDRVDVALAADADGVHLGREDMDAATARRLLGEGRILGLTVKTEAEADAVDPPIVDYVSVGGVFATRSKHNPEPPIGLAGLADRVARLRRRGSTMPISAIAGVGFDNAADVVAAGADGVAVIGAIADADAPRAAAASLKDIVTAARAGRAIHPKESSS